MTVAITHEVFDKDGTRIGYEWIDLDKVGLTGAMNPTGLPDPITMVQLLQWYQANPAKLAQAGWMDPATVAGTNYASKFASLKAAVVRMNHAGARAALGV